MIPDGEITAALDQLRGVKTLLGLFYRKNNLDEIKREVRDHRQVDASARRALEEFESLFPLIVSGLQDAEKELQEALAEGGE